MNEPKQKLHKIAIIFWNDIKRCPQIDDKRIKVKKRVDSFWLFLFTWTESKKQIFIWFMEE